MNETNETFLIPYPKGVLRAFFRLPLVAYRLGWGNLVGMFPYVVITTIGRKSGLPRHTVLEYRRHGSKWYLISGWGDQSDWVKNSLAHPIVTAQIGGKPRRAKIISVTNTAESLRAIYMFRRRSYIYDVILSSIGNTSTIDFRTLTEVAHRFTVFRLEFDDSVPPENDGVVADLGQLGWAIIVGSLLLLLWGITRPLRR